jgi:hypothetical protein
MAQVGGMKLRLTMRPSNVVYSETRGQPSGLIALMASPRPTRYALEAKRSRHVAVAIRELPRDRRKPEPTMRAVAKHRVADASGATALAIVGDRFRRRLRFDAEQ